MKNEQIIFICAQFEMINFQVKFDEVHGGLNNVVFIKSLMGVSGKKDHIFDALTG